MYKKLFSVCVFVVTILTLAQFAAADYTLTNGTNETVWVAYSRWLPANGNWPEGWRTQGWYKIEPGQRKVLRVPQRNPWVYIRVINTNGEVKPPNHATKDKAPFWIHPSEAFTAVETSEGDFLRSEPGRWSLKTVNFYEYRNGGSHTIVDEPRLPDLPAPEIYNQAMPSVVWIATSDGDWLGKGSGVLIDKARRLVVTNAHVVQDAELISVFFPFRQSGRLVKDEDFYFKNREWLDRRGFHTSVRIIAKNIRNDLAILQLADLPTNAREIKHDFSRDVEDNMKRGDKVHILGNPGEQLWNWDEGTFLRSGQNCLPSGGDCLIMEVGVRGGNSGGPVLNGQGTLIGIITATDHETAGFAAPSRNIKALLNGVPADLPPVPPQQIPPQQIHPKRTFKIRNQTGVTIPYQILWSNNDDWQSSSLETGFIRTHTSSGQNVLSGYPKIRFDHIAGDGQQVTYRTYALETVLFRENNNDHAPAYRFEYNQWGNRLDLLKGAAPTVYPKRTFKIRNQTGVTISYQILWSNSDDWQSSSLETGFIRTHTSSGQNVLSGYPKIRFDHIAGDGRVTYLVYNLESANANANVAPTYRFEYNQRGDRLDLYRDGFAAPALSTVSPEETTLSFNYPNPFNPETWIPYQLSKPAEVTVTIHAADGRLIRTLALGHQPAGIYQSKSRAAYWDGKNELGESVASGVYFYTLKAGDFTATRKMLIRK